jgi:ATP-dependent helicase/nuclease subunit A
MPFVVRHGGSLMEGVIDRLVLMGEGGRVVRAEIVDFKTDAVDGLEPAKLQERVGYYGEQMEVYRRAVCGMYDLSPEAVCARLAMVDAGQVVVI